MTWNYTRFRWHLVPWNDVMSSFQGEVEVDGDYQEQETDHAKEQRKLEDMTFSLHEIVLDNGLGSRFFIYTGIE